MTSKEKDARVLKLRQLVSWHAVEAVKASNDGLDKLEAYHQASAELLATLALEAIE